MKFLLGESTDKEMIAIAERLNFINQTEELEELFAILNQICSKE